MGRRRYRRIQEVNKTARTKWISRNHVFVLTWLTPVRRETKGLNPGERLLRIRKRSLAKKGGGQGRN